MNLPTIPEERFAQWLIDKGIEPTPCPACNVGEMAINISSEQDRETAIHMKVVDSNGTEGTFSECRIICLNCGYTRSFAVRVILGDVGNDNAV